MNHLTKPAGLQLTNLSVQSIPLTVQDNLYSEKHYTKLLNNQLVSVKKNTRKLKTNTRNSTKKNK